MEEIIKKLKKIVEQQLDECTEKKTIPSGMTLDIVKLIMTYEVSQ